MDYTGLSMAWAGHRLGWHGLGCPCRVLFWAWIGLSMGWEWAGLSMYFARHGLGWA
jgi:hypothetical protein